MLDDALRRQITSQLKGYIKAHIGQDFVAYLSEADNQIEACVFLVIQEKPANPRFSNGRTGLLLNVYTRVPYRRRGISKSLITHIIEESQEVMSLSFIELTATSAGKQLYKDLGFELKEQKDDMILYLS